jgi:hypothetical protein
MSAPPPPFEPQPQASGAVLSLVLGILGIVLGPLCGPFAWVMGRKAELEVRASAGGLSGGGVATAGKILGIIGSIFLVLMVLAFVVLFAAGSSPEQSSALRSV